MIHRHTDQQIQDYFEHIGINQSALKVLISGGIQTFLDQRDTLQRQSDLYYEEKKHFIIGSAVDCEITQGKEVFDSKYHISKLIKKPGEKTMSVVKRAFDMALEAYPLGPDSDINLFKTYIYNACNNENYYMNRAKPTVEEDTRLGTLLKENAAAYWLDLSISAGKQILSDEEGLICNSIVMSLLTHKHTVNLFKDGDDIDIIYQLPLYFSLLETDCKGMLDMVLINHTRKKIMPLDIKTMGDYVTNFPKALDLRRYDLQGAFYTEGLKQNLTQVSTLIGKPVTDYTIANFAFMVESSVKPGCPLVYVLREDLLERGKNGEVTAKGRDFLGYIQGLEIYKSWEAIDFSLPKRFEQTNGVVFLDSNYSIHTNM